MCTKCVWGPDAAACRGQQEPVTVRRQTKKNNGCDSPVVCFFFFFYRFLSVKNSSGLHGNRPAGGGVPGPPVAALPGGAHPVGLRQDPAQSPHRGSEER